MALTSAHTIAQPPSVTDFAQRLDHAARVTEARLAAHLDHDGPTYRGSIAPPPQRLTDAMRQAVLGGGKRFRPFLVIEAAALFGLPVEAALDTAASLECLHCYSLVHDDLPAMDNDDVRRGRPTVHKAFDDWTAILAGDGLLTLALIFWPAPRPMPIPASGRASYLRSPARRAAEAWSAARHLILKLTSLAPPLCRRQPTSARSRP